MLKVAQSLGVQDIKNGRGTRKAIRRETREAEGVTVADIEDALTPEQIADNHRGARKRGFWR